ncbi:hypothetical protein QQF64_024003 [Cirrhinus molitorella]|uniref:Uncharacterized protein n=1 Tax=Cirrhinus molitorella TaxID=172907 RepID=A0ABR3NL83_9TELE
MGEAAILSHMQGKKHRLLLAACSSTPSVTTFMSQSNVTPQPMSSNEAISATNKRQINIGFVADKLLTELKVRKKISEKDVLTVRKETKDFLVTAVTKLLEKCPLKYTLVRNLAWLDPQKIKEKPDLCEKQLRLCLQIISSAGQIRENKCDMILSQFRDFAVICKMSNDALEWPTGAHSRLDTFFHAQLAKEYAFKDLWEIVQKVLLLSHGQAFVERGFSINKNITVTNMKE